ncbi:hypothetical protein [Streptomonospora salina]|uniref:Uncharacterized protein n=1 Tax=Streptomonospora salina TaxID=104205 RepID=A0A841EGT2_9ACTN|nr:hypothetical protein [Streptomonospora salina]MBB6000233.1 hypothetical protein [Streptomonospora salina]
MNHEETLRDLLPAGWDVTALGDLVCPCGDLIEPDGGCPEGCVSPLREAGWI